MQIVIVQFILNTVYKAATLSSHGGEKYKID
jgi:hypothetical protein